MITLRIEDILRERGISKTQFAEMMGVAKQNVNLLLNTNNIKKIEEIANKLGVKFSYLINDDSQTTKSNIIGFIEVDGEVIKVSSVQDLEEVVQRLKELK